MNRPARRTGQDSSSRAARAARWAPGGLFSRAARAARSAPGGLFSRAARAARWAPGGLFSRAARRPVIMLAIVALLGTACASGPPSAERAACFKFRSSSEVNDSSSIVLLVVGVTNPERFRSATARELLSANPPGTEGESKTIVVTPGEAGVERVMIERLSKRLGVIADYRNRSTKSKISTDLPIRCHWPKPSVDLMRDTIDE